MPAKFLEILLDGSAHKYLPGDIISGKVFTKTETEVKVKGLEISFTGNAYVSWEERAGNSVIAVPTESCIYFTFAKNLIDSMDGNEIIIPPGESSYPFTFQLPDTPLPCTFVGEHGYVEYQLLAVGKRDVWKSDFKEKKEIVVMGVLDLNVLPSVSQPGMWDVGKTFCCLCCTSGLLQISVKLEKTGYIPAERIKVVVGISNMSGREVEDVSMELSKRVVYTAGANNKATTDSIATVTRGKGVKAGESDSWKDEIEIPINAYPNKLGSGCKLIDVGYVIRVEAHMIGFGYNLKLSCPILIGTVPLNVDLQDVN